MVLTLLLAPSGGPVKMGSSYQVKTPGLVGTRLPSGSTVPWPMGFTQRFRHRLAARVASSYDGGGNVPETVEMLYMRYGMKIAVFLMLALTLGAGALAGEFEVPIHGGATPWTTLEAGAEPGDFTFAIVPDRTGGNRPGPFRETMKRLNALGPDFVVSVGDLIQGYSEDPAVLRTEWEELDGIVTGLRMPFFYTPGNHDISNDAMEGFWKARYGRAYYHFKRGNALFLVMNTQDPPGGGPRFSEEQIAYFKQVIEENQDVRWTFILFHQPTWVDGENPLAAIETALEGRPYTVFAGHYHGYSYTERKGRNYIVCATAGGGSNLAGPLRGSFDHVVWVRVDRDGPHITNVLLNGLYGPDVVGEETERLRDTLAKATGILSIPPVIVGPEGLKAETVSFEVENRQILPAILTGSFSENPEVAVSPAKLEIPLAVDGRRRIELKVTPRNGVADRLPAPLVFDGTAVYHLPDGQEVRVPCRAPIAFVRAYEDRRWDFDDGLGGWGKPVQAKLSVKDGILQVQATGIDPYMTCSFEDDGSAGPTGSIVLRLRLRGSSDGPLQVFWMTRENPAASEQRSSGCLIEHDGAWHEYEVTFTAKAPITSIRIDSGSAPGLIEYDYIELAQR